jgi:hypothetical protein
MEPLNESVEESIIKFQNINKVVKSREKIYSKIKERIFGTSTIFKTFQKLADIFEIEDLSMAELDENWYKITKHVVLNNFPNRLRELKDRFEKAKSLTWEEAKTKFISIVDPNFNRADVEGELMDLKFENTYGEFRNQFKNLVEEDSLLLGHILFKKLPGDIQNQLLLIKKLKNSDYKCSQDIFDMLDGLVSDNYRISTNMIIQNKKRKCDDEENSYPNKIKKITNMNIQKVCKFYPNCKYGDKCKFLHGGNNQLLQGHNKNPIKQKLCFICDSPDHIAKNCPRKNKNPQNLFLEDVCCLTSYINSDNWVELPKIKINKVNVITHVDTKSNICVINSKFADKIELKSTGKRKVKVLNGDNIEINEAEVLITMGSKEFKYKCGISELPGKFDFLIGIDLIKTVGGIIKIEIPESEEKSNSLGIKILSNYDDLNDVLIKNQTYEIMMSACTHPSAILKVNLDKKFGKIRRNYQIGIHNVEKVTNYFKTCLEEDIIEIVRDNFWGN